jgi:SAM-dependent methyltransferase
MEPTAESMRKLYDRRFGAELRARKDSLWKVLCEDFFQRYVSERDTVVDLGAGYCEFINHIRAGHKFAVDLNDDTPESAAPDVAVVLTAADNMTQFESNSVDVVFSSNLFEHIRGKDELVSILHEVHRVLKPGKKLLVLMPNIRYAFKEYWDYFDHHLPLSHHSLAEVLTFTDFDVKEVRSRFLPYTFKTRLPQTDLLLRLYLRLRPVQLLFGRQMFVVANKISA